MNQDLTLHQRVEANEFDRFTLQGRRAFAEALREEYGTDAVAHEYCFGQAEWLAQDHRGVGRTSALVDGQWRVVEQHHLLHVMYWYDVLSKAARAGAGRPGMEARTYPDAE